MNALKGAVFIYTVIVSFIFPSEKTLFLALFATYASIFCDFYSLSKKLPKNKSTQLSGAYLYVMSFCFMLLCSLGSGNIRIAYGDDILLSSNILWISFIGGIDNRILFSIEYVVFALCVLLLTCVNVIITICLTYHFSESESNKRSFQDFIV